MTKNLLIILTTLFILSSCNKNAGEGGTSTIKGKITAKYTDVFGNTYKYAIAKEDVYIIYGDEDFYGDNIETSYDGTFEFKYLRKGKYTLFAYSDCDTCLDGRRAEFLSVDITKNHSEITTDSLIVIKN